MYLVTIYPHDDVSHSNIRTMIDLRNVNEDHTIVVVAKIQLHISSREKNERVIF